MTHSDPVADPEPGAPAFAGEPPRWTGWRSRLISLACFAFLVAVLALAAAFLEGLREAPPCLPAPTAR